MQHWGRHRSYQSHHRISSGRAKGPGLRTQEADSETRKRTARLKAMSEHRGYGKASRRHHSREEGRQRSGAAKALGDRAEQQLRVTRAKEEGALGGRWPAPRLGSEGWGEAQAEAEWNGCLQWRWTAGREGMCTRWR